MDSRSMNRFMGEYLEVLGQSQDAELCLANSIWLRDDPGLIVEPGFLDINANYYGADVRRAVFDSGTVREINKWVSAQTDGMIRRLLDRIPDAAAMYLVNALAFDAQWEEVYRSSDVRKGLFTEADGDHWYVPMMHSEERRYLEDAGATGFIKYYEGGEYAFAALLPKEGISLREYAATLDGGHLQELLTNAEDVLVLASMPKFEVEYDIELGGVLRQMGMVDAFREDAADFSRLGTWDGGELYIGRVLHRTFISVAEQGTRAGAASAVKMLSKGAQELPPHKTVDLDRPFVYLLIDAETCLPIFIGSVLEIDAAETETKALPSHRNAAGPYAKVYL